MRLWIITCAAVATICVSGCEKKAPDAAAADAASTGWDPFGVHHGRYVGLGIYSPQEPWTKMAGAAQSKDNPAARPIDDQAIFVVVDSATGELRACGDLTGYCIGMNPWKKPLTPAQIAPIILTEHVKPPEIVADAKARTPSKTRSNPKSAKASAPNSSSPPSE
jgi:hypothetical protein